MNTEGFLEKYHKMVEDTLNAPKIFRNLKEGDKVWWIDYSYRGNGKTKSSIKIHEYTVHHLNEYYVDDRNRPLDPRSFFIYVMRNVHHMITWSSDPSVETGVWKDEIMPDSIGAIYKNDGDMDRDISIHHDTIHCYVKIIAFDKEKAINAIRRIVTERENKHKIGFEKFLESETKTFKEVDDEYNDILKEIEDESNR